MNNKFWELLADSVIVQAIVTVILMVAVVYLAVIGKEIPDVLGAAFSLALGYYFGSKAQLQLIKTAKK